MRSTLTLLLAAATLAVSASPFVERELYVTANDGVRMGATLTVPDTEPLGVIVLATGSGIQNRDEEVFGKKPFKTLAEHLSREGCAVLRVDDRGYADIADARNATMATYSADVAAAVAMADSLFAGMPVGIIGHSCGALYAVDQAVHNPRVDFIVTLAGPAWSGDSLVMAQSRTIATALTGRYDAEPLQRRIMDVAKSKLAEPVARAIITQAYMEHLGDGARLPQAREHIRQQVDGVLSPWYRSMLRYDPVSDIEAVKVPWLAINGEKDVQVPPASLATIKELNPSADTMMLEGHNHLFQQCTTGMVDEYATLEGDLSDVVLDAISEWICATLRDLSRNTVQKDK